MKKQIGLLLLGLLMLSCCLVSCEEEAGDIVGVWKITECIVDGKALADMNDCFFYFYEDNTGKKVILDALQFTYSYSFDGVTCVLFNITYDDGTTEAGTYAEINVTGDTMIIHATEDSVEEIVTLKRQNETTTEEPMR